MEGVATPPALLSMVVFVSSRLEAITGFSLVFVGFLKKPSAVTYPIEFPSESLRLAILNGLIKDWSSAAAE